MCSVAENNWRAWWPSQAVLKLNPRVAGETDALAQEGSALELWTRAGVAPHVLATLLGRR